MLAFRELQQSLAGGCVEDDVPSGGRVAEKLRSMLQQPFRVLGFLRLTIRVWLGGVPDVRQLHLRAGIRELAGERDGIPVVVRVVVGHDVLDGHQMRPAQAPSGTGSGGRPNPGPPPAGKLSAGTSDGYTSWPCTARSPSSRSFSSIRSGTNSFTSRRRMKVPIAEKRITQSAVSACHLNSSALP